MEELYFGQFCTEIRFKYEIRRIRNADIGTQGFCFMSRSAKSFVGRLWDQNALVDFYKLYSSDRCFRASPHRLLLCGWFVLLLLLLHLNFLLFLLWSEFGQ